jgi:acyl-homoserine lactone acylase PvdQ
VFHSGEFSTRIVRTRPLGAAWRLVLGALAVCAALAIGVTPARGATFTDDSGGAFQILAPGEEGEFPPNEFSTDQGELYNALTRARGHVSTRRVERDYLSEKFGVAGPVLRTEHPRAGLEIVRDSHDVPHIYGETRADVMFGSGWVAAQDRGLLLALGLGPGYVAALGVPGLNPFELLETGRSFTPSAEAVEFVAKQTQSLIEKGPRGEQVIEDLEDWAQGINAYEETLGARRLLPPVNLPDAIAGFALIGSIFGNGGGGEVTNSNFLAHLEAKFGESEALKIFHDLRESNDPEAPTTTSIPFPYDKEPEGTPPAGAAVIEPGSVSAPAAKAEQAVKSSRRKASNFLLVGAENAKDGHPMAVMGPQLGYFYPELVFQADMHGPGIDAEGIVAPISPYVFIGRGRDFAWSLTSAGSEDEQQFLLKLCNPDHSPPTRESEDYEHDGECVPMTSFDAGELGAGNGEPAHEVFFKESIYGPVTGTVMVKDEPYAVAEDRTTRGREPAGELAFSDLDSDRVHSPEQFFEAANELETTFNMAYVDSKHIAFFSTGRLPILASETDPALPTFGTGQYEWQGFLSEEEHPHAVGPANGELLNWNNKPAPEWGAASNEYDYGPVQRVQLYKGFTTGMTEASDVSIMNGAATQDLRAVAVWPVIEQVLASGPAPSKPAEEAASLVSQWVASGSSLYGVNRPKAPAAAVMDAIWTPIAEAVLGPVLGPELLSEFASFNAPDNPPSPTGSSFDGGWEGYVYKDLRSLLGQPVAQPYSRQYYGKGSLETCRDSLWAVVQAAAEHLKATQGSKMSGWRAESVRIAFAPGLLPYTMSWTNRSTFQQVIEFTSHQEEDLTGPLE